MRLFASRDRPLRFRCSPFHIRQIEQIVDNRKPRPFCKLKTRTSRNEFLTRISSSWPSIIGSAAREVTTARFLRNSSIAIAGLRDRARVPRWNLTGMSTFSGFDFTVERESTCVVATGQTGQLLSQRCPRKVIVVRCNAWSRTISC